MAKATKQKYNYDHLPKKNYKVKDVVELAEEVNGAKKGSKCEVTGVQFGGVVFIVKVITGNKTGASFRIRATDLV